MKYIPMSFSTSFIIAFMWIYPFSFKSTRQPKKYNTNSKFKRSKIWKKKKIFLITLRHALRVRVMPIHNISCPSRIIFKYFDQVLNEMILIFHKNINFQLCIQKKFGISRDSYTIDMSLFLCFYCGLNGEWHRINHKVV